MCLCGWTGRELTCRSQTVLQMDELKQFCFPDLFIGPSFICNTACYRSRIEKPKTPKLYEVVTLPQIHVVTWIWHDLLSSLRWNETLYVIGWLIILEIKLPDIILFLILDYIYTIAQSFGVFISTLNNPLLVTRGCLLCIGCYYQLLGKRGSESGSQPLKTPASNRLFHESAKRCALMRKKIKNGLHRTDVQLLSPFPNIFVIFITIEIMSS